MPRRPPIDPEGTYHVGSRGSYGRALYVNAGQHEVFLWMYERVAKKYGWDTYAWALVQNHYHFVIRLTDGGLSEGMRQLNGGFSRWRNEIDGETGKGHLVRHAFFARRLQGDGDAIRTCAYVDLNPIEHRATFAPRRSDWSGLAATLGMCHPRRFHRPAALLELLSSKPAAARKAYREILQKEHAQRRQVPSPNDVIELRLARMIQSVA
jgi:REP element-mobilizing transposase RayT